MRTIVFILTTWFATFAFPTRSTADEPLFEDDFESGLSAKWQLVDMKKEDYRIHDGKLQIKVQQVTPSGRTPMLKVDKPLRRHEFAGLCLTDKDGESFSGKKTNIDGFQLLSPGEVNFVGKPGEEGDATKYSVKYWPADKAAGPLNIILRGNYAFFQVGPATDKSYKTFFHSAISATDSGLGFALFAGGATSSEECWVSFDNFRVWKH
jgi:hypothetical protein